MTERPKKKPDFSWLNPSRFFIWFAIPLVVGLVEILKLLGICNAGNWFLSTNPSGTACTVDFIEPLASLPSGAASYIFTVFTAFGGPAGLMIALAVTSLLYLYCLIASLFFMWRFTASFFVTIDTAASNAPDESIALFIEEQSRKKD